MFIHLQSGNYSRWLMSKAGFLGVVAGMTFAAPGQVSAQGATDDGMLEEIVVTSRRYEESIKDAPVAVAVMSQEFIYNNRITRVDDILNYTPGATYESFSKMQPVASMRGLIAPTPGNASSEASIQTVVDNVVITKDFMKSPPLFDLQRVEVMRGPQGTAFGRNASVGLLHFVTNRPNQTPSGQIIVTAGSDDRFEVQGFMNRPMSDTTAIRIAINHTQEDGQTESISTGQGLDGVQNTAIRASMLMQPSDNFSAYFKAEFSADRDEAPVRHGYFQAISGDTCTSRAYVYGRGDVDPGYPDNPAVAPNANGAYAETWFAPCEPFTTEISAENVAGFPTVDFHTDRDILTLVADFSWNFGNDLTATWITGHMDGETDNLQDVIGSPNDVNWQFVSNDGRSTSTEFRIDNTASDSRVRWLVGTYLLRDKESRTEQLLFQQRDGRTGEPNPPGFPGNQFVPTLRETGGTNETESFSIFGEITFDIGERSTITYGGRFVDDTKDYVTGSRGFGVNRQLVFLPGVDSERQDGSPAICTNFGPPRICASEADPVGFSDHLVSKSWDDYISKLSYTFNVSDTMNVYALYSEGFKSGTFQPDALNPAQADIPVNPETSTNFEVGLKGAGERFQYSVTAFYMELDDVQTVNLVPAGAAFVGLLSNIGQVETTGLEVDGTFLVTDNFLINGSFAIIDAEMKNTPDPVDDTIDISGHRPPGAPEWTYNLIAEYTLNFSGGSTLQFRGDVRGRSDVYNQTSSRTGPRADYRLRPEVQDFGARITWMNADQNLAVALWGKNLAEDWDITNFGPPTPCCSSFAAGFRGKTEYGLTFTVDF